VKSKDCLRGTAEYSISRGHYDYCVFPAFKEYEDLKASEKLQLLMESVNSDTESSSGPWSSSILPGIMDESVMVTFDAQSDIFVEPRTKYIHSVGVVGAIKFRSTGHHNYTGVFQGHEHGLMRLSSAKKPGLPGFPDIVPSWTPGAGFKFLRDGRPSANFLAMPSLDGQSCLHNNFFEHDFSNHVNATGDFALGLIASKFWQGSYCPQMVGISDLASEAEKLAKAPWRLILHPLVEVQCSCLSYASCLQTLSELAPDTDVFEVRALERPRAVAEPIGYISLTSRLTTSKFGDEQLFFKHQRMEDDFKSQPAWLEQIDKSAMCGMEAVSTAAPSVANGCKSPFKTSDGMRKDDYLAI
jgi:hypothetical protein